MTARGCWHSISTIVWRMRENSLPRVVGPVWKYPADDDDQIPHARQLEPGNSSLHADGVSGTASTRGWGRTAHRAWPWAADRHRTRSSRSTGALRANCCGNSGRASLTLPNRPPDRNNNRGGQLRGNAGRRRAECLCRRDRSARSDRRPTLPVSMRNRAPLAGPDMWERPRRNRDNNFGFMGGMQASTILAGRLQPSAALARRLHSLLSDESGRPGGDRCGDRIDTLGGELSTPGAPSARRRRSSAT